MAESQLQTAWDLIRGAASGDAQARAHFAVRYLDVVRGYLAARWQGSRLGDSVEDAVQEVFLDCYREEGALARVDADRPGGFRPFLFGVVRNVALHFETRLGREVGRRAPDTIALDGLRSDDESQSRVFDRAFARAVMRAAADLQGERARAAGDGASRRVELLRLRFEEGLPIREIARRWGDDPARVHHEYARARREFRSALQSIVQRDEGWPPDRVAAECQGLLDLLR